MAVQYLQYPTDGELLAMMDRCNNWGKWGKDDELGTLNYIDASVVTAAARQVRDGRVVSLGRPLSGERTEVNYVPIDFKMTASPHDRYKSTHDWFGIEVHGYAVTHLDAITHCAFQDQVYGGMSFDDAWGYHGMRWGAITAMAGGIFTRGVLLDVARTRGVEFLEPGDYVMVADLEAAEAALEAPVGRGDAVLVHLGLAAWEERLGRPQEIALRAGLHPECVEWLHERQASLFGGDCVERIPGESSLMPMPLHHVGLVGMGLTLLDWPDVAPLARHCAEAGRRSFLFTCAPLKIPGGTGSAVNPLAVF